MQHEKNFRITFFVNMKHIFTWLVASYTLAIEYSNVLAEYDLGRRTIEDDKYAGMLNAYRAFRRQHGINHPDAVVTSELSIDQRDSVTNVWWMVSERSNDEPDYELGEMHAFDTETDKDESASDMDYGVSDVY